MERPAPTSLTPRVSVVGSAVGATAGAMSGSRVDEQIEQQQAQLAQQRQVDSTTLRGEIGDDAYAGLSAPIMRVRNKLKNGWCLTCI